MAWQTRGGQSSLDRALPLSCLFSPSPPGKTHRFSRYAQSSGDSWDHGGKHVIQLTAVVRRRFGRLAQIVRPRRVSSVLPTHHACMSTVGRGVQQRTLVTPTPLPLPPIALTLLNQSSGPRLFIDQRARKRPAHGCGTARATPPPSTLLLKPPCFLSISITTACQSPLQ
jgi:hypothetical protein